MGDELKLDEGRILVKDVASTAEPGKKRVLFDCCHLTVKDDNIVAECDSVEASEELAKLLMKDVFIRIKPDKVSQEQS